MANEHKMRSQKIRVPTLALLPPTMHPSFPGGSERKESACSAGDPCSIPGLGRCPGKGNGYPLQYSCLRIPRTEESGGI